MQNKPYIPTTPKEIHESQIFAAALLEVAASNLVNTVRNLLADDQSEEAAFSILQTLSVPLARLTDAEWNRVRRSGVKPCGKTGCNCHEIKARAFDSFDHLRDKQTETNAQHAAAMRAARPVPVDPSRRVH